MRKKSRTRRKNKEGDWLQRSKQRKIRRTVFHWWILPFSHPRHHHHHLPHCNKLCLTVSQKYWSDKKSSSIHGAEVCSNVLVILVCMGQHLGTSWRHSSPENSVYVAQCGCRRDCIKSWSALIHLFPVKVIVAFWRMMKAICMEMMLEQL